MIDFDQIRKEVAIEHNLLLDKDDPVLVAVTLNELVLQRYAEILTEQNKEFLKAVEASQQKSIVNAKQTASKIITEASDYVSEQVNTAVTAAFDEGLEKIRKSQVVEEGDVSVWWASYYFWSLAFFSSTTLYFGLFYFLR